MTDPFRLRLKVAMLLNKHVTIAKKMISASLGRKSRPKLETAAEELD